MKKSIEVKESSSNGLENSNVDILANMPSFEEYIKKKRGLPEKIRDAKRQEQEIDDYNIAYFQNMVNSWNGKRSINSAEKDNPFLEDFINDDATGNLKTVEELFSEEKKGEPSKIRKIGRIAMRVFGRESVSRKSQIRREREYMGIALKRQHEYINDINERTKESIAVMERVEENERKRKEQEREQKRLDIERKLKRQQEAEANARRKQEEAEVIREKAELKDIFGNWVNKKEERPAKEEIRGVIEEKLNAGLTTVDELEEAASIGEDGVEKGFIEYDGIEIPTYTLKGIPCAMLITRVDYQRTPGTNSWYVDKDSIARRVYEDPSLWGESKEEALRDEDMMRSGTICSSLIVSSKEGAMRGLAKGGRLIYGFNSVKPESVGAVRNGDAGSATGHMVEFKNVDNLNEKSLNDFFEMIQGYGPEPYNEIVINRYDSTGKPKLPDYIVVDGSENIAERIKKHAKYFGIPIVIIDEKAYEK